MIRLAHFPPGVPVKIDVVAVAPGKQDFAVKFDQFSIALLSTPPQEN
jgi:regulation of enolase protein 1 (concanavalin A-like superfamily)